MMVPPVVPPSGSGLSVTADPSSVVSDPWTLRLTALIGTLIVRLLSTRTV
jgi:hypothetical protein